MPKFRFSPEARRMAEALADECVRLGLPKPRFAPGGKHHKAWVTIQGKDYALNICRSPSDRNAHKAKVRDLHMLLRSLSAA